MEVYIEFIIGILLILIGGLIWGKQKIQLIHDYHHGNVKAEDIPAYTRAIGQEIVVMGTSCLLLGLFSYWQLQAVGFVIFAILFLLATVRLYLTQRKYNGGLFS